MHLVHIPMDEYDMPCGAGNVQLPVGQSTRTSGRTPPRPESMVDLVSESNSNRPAPIRNVSVIGIVLLIWSVAFTFSTAMTQGTDVRACCVKRPRARDRTVMAPPSRIGCLDRVSFRGLEAVNNPTHGRRNLKKSVKAAHGPRVPSSITSN